MDQISSEELRLAMAREDCLQRLEERILQIDLMEILGIEDGVQERLSVERNEVYDEVIEKWRQVVVDQSFAFVFNEESYKEYVEGLHHDMLLKSSRTLTRSIRLKITARCSMRIFTVSSSDSNEQRSFLDDFVFNLLWDRDIEGWQRLVDAHDDPVIKSWFSRFLARAVQYKNQCAKERAGGEAVLYDFTSTRGGPYDTEGKIEWFDS